MNMFSMKPKFDLAAFLAVPAPVGAARRKGRQFQTAAAPKTPAPDVQDATPETKTD